MSTIDAIGSTAFIIAAVRAGEAAREPALFEDPYAKLFSQPEIDAATRRYEAMAPFLTQSVRLRTCWFDATVRDAVSTGTTQIVILGAGFDCRAQRLSCEGVAFYEVDRGPVLQFKADRLQHESVNPRSVHIHGDYTSPDLIDWLVAAGLDVSKQTLVLWEGNTYYLPNHLISSVLRRLASELANVMVAFDCFHSEVIAGRSKSPSMFKAIPILRGIGAPWQGSVDDAEGLAREVGMRVVHSKDTPTLHALHGAGIDLGPDIECEYSACLLAN